MVRNTSNALSDETLNSALVLAKLAALTEKFCLVQGEWVRPMQKAAELEDIQMQGTANLCLQGARPCRARHYQLPETLISEGPSDQMLELIADAAEDESGVSWASITVPRAADEALTVVLAPKGGESFVLRRDFAGTLLLDGSTYLNLANVSMDQECSSESVLQV